MSGFNVTFSVRNDNQNTIWNKLKGKLGRDPTERECRDEFTRLISEWRPVSDIRKIINQKAR